ncbi:hypothetical protein HIM_07720 [Hirsutella minnesotensis 3608]|uniref:Uncharacterized protein n=1 Tax=Hirsutella minnesotensis 3608 TaxID=1043627 RepID=A0A0F7ZYS0_9HYPO|nr:hypothetical protein HIM_07720 [Hirsutella minnesotensis 3608]
MDPDAARIHVQPRPPVFELQRGAMLFGSARLCLTCAVDDVPELANPASDDHGGDKHPKKDVWHGEGRWRGAPSPRNVVLAGTDLEPFKAMDNSLGVERLPRAPPLPAER